MRYQADQVDTGSADLDRLLVLIRTSRLAAKVLNEQVATWTRLALAHPAIPKSDRDAAAVLGLSYQRVCQLRQRELRQGQLRQRTGTDPESTDCAARV